MKKGKKNNEAPGGIDTTFLDTRVDNETTKKNQTKKNRQKKGHSPNKKTIKSQNRNTNTTDIFTQA